MSENQNNRAAFATRTVHAGQEHDPVTGAVMQPIYQTSTYAQESPGVHKGFVYARGANPTRFAASTSGVANRVSESPDIAKPSGDGAAVP